MNKAYSKWYQDEDGVVHKQCTKCKNYYTLDMYGNHKSCRFGKNPWCNNCVKQYALDNKKEIKEKNAKRYNTILKHDKDFVKRNRDKANKHYEGNREKKLTYAENYRNDIANKEGIKEYLKNYAEDNKEHLKKYNKNWRTEHKKELSAYQKQKKKNDPYFRIRTVISSQVSAALKKQGGSKNGVSFFKAIGYTKQDLKHHLDRLLEKEMSWENYGTDWVVDHIIPRSFFEYRSMSDQDFKDCWALENLRPLLREENNIRGNRVTITNKMVEDIYGKIRSHEEIEQLKRRFCRNPKILCDASS